MGAALGISQVLAETKDGKIEDAAAKAISKGAREKNEKALKEAKDELELPIPKGQPQKKLNVPLRDADGKMQMNLEIGIATKIDDTRVKLEKLRVETYREDGKTVDLDMDLPDAIYDKTTKIITSEVAVKIVRGDMEIVGQNMSFHVKEHTGALGGGVKAIIYDRGSMVGGEKKTSVEFQKPPATPPATPPNKEKK